jgi:chromosome segregation protein
MQLIKIKMSGFKSFVDPATVILPSNLVAVVGPNGCGKSNIIDAVTWVMGESSPKYLRGEALTDVIFNGSSARKPVGQASVELIFDNSDGTIGGEYGKFAELSIKRMINRDSDSTYYLNGVRCRKRDVVDIFLGTGLGPRSYSIIGQNMIGHIIEAKPSELRTYLEEAAGISKYKERRHETELRISHTKENLSRVNDVALELEKQLSHLKHQANAAEKYKLLKQQERILHAELSGIKWRQIDSRMVDHTLKIQREETALYGRQSEQTSVLRDIEQLRHEQRVAYDAHHEVQRHYYSVGNEITRIEQDILHHQEREQQWNHDLKQTEEEWREIKHQLANAEDELREIEHGLTGLDPEFSSAKVEVQKLESEHSLTEKTMQEWQNRWDEFNQSASKIEQTVQVEKAHIKYLEQRIALLQNRKDQIQGESDQFNFELINKDIEELTKQSYIAREKIEFEQRKIEELRKEIAILYAAEKDSHTHLDSIRNELQRIHGEEASLAALQQIALGQRDNLALTWLAKHQLNDKPRLAQHLEVEKGWELAVEAALGFCLQAICADERKDIISHVKDFTNGKLCVFTPVAGKIGAKQKGQLLLEKIKSPWPLQSLIGGIYTAGSLEEASTLCESLDANESVITKDGIWLNRSWLKIFRENEEASHVILREQELKQLALTHSHLKETQAQLESGIANRRHHIQTLEKERDELLKQYSENQAQSAEINMQCKMKNERLSEMKEKALRFVSEQEDCKKQLSEVNEELSDAKSVWQQASDEFEKQKDIRESLMKERQKHQHQLQTMRSELNHKREAMHELDMRLQATKSQKFSLKETMVRLQAHLNSLNDRKINLQSDITSMPPLDALKKSLSRALDKHVSVEGELNTARIAMESLEQEDRNLQNKRELIDRDMNKIRQSLETLRVEWQGWKVKADTLMEQMNESELTIEEILKELPQDISIDEWQNKLDQVGQRINRLGPINLAAIDEYATCLERKQYLDKQLEDLQAGLTTLEDAIAKIDKETRQRFKETFDQLNEQFQTLFPTVFGGGKAYLELTSDNLLEAGVTMMACPPGKRNSSIYLLSGGEKSLTAIAFIFSIFTLNPAPFCLLDEVDAALDDANVSRFTHLVKTMANKTQFIFISHNKITIEMAEHLIGVTMNEPGVSRLVSVDIEKAISFAASES